MGRRKRHKVIGITAQPICRVKFNRDEYPLLLVNVWEKVSCPDCLHIKKTRVYTVLGYEMIGGEEEDDGLLV